MSSNFHRIKTHVSDVSHPIGRSKYAMENAFVIDEGLSIAVKLSFLKQLTYQHKIEKSEKNGSKSLSMTSPAIGHFGCILCGND